jgi:hypothetical protein
VTTQVQIETLAATILAKFRGVGLAGASGYKQFRYGRETQKAVIVVREGGQEARVPVDRLRTAIRAVMENPSIYEGGPSQLRASGVTHVTSPIWALIRLLPPESYCGKS